MPGHPRLLQCGEPETVSVCRRGAVGSSPERADPAHGVAGFARTCVGAHLGEGGVHPEMPAIAYSEVSWATLRSMAGRRSQSQDSSITSGLLHFVHATDRASMR